MGYFITDELFGKLYDLCNWKIEPPSIDDILPVADMIVTTAKHIDIKDFEELERRLKGSSWQLSSQEIQSLKERANRRRI